MHIDQVLHGYNNGHHLIASSVSLPLKDADNMSYLSDWSGYVNPFNRDTSYISAYPLAESQSYVIAKSWYADEMSRPGCVWTHSLVVKIDKLGQKFNFLNLLKLFRRPEREGEDYLTYTKPIELDDDTQNEIGQPINGIDPTRFMFMSAFLLDRQKHAVYKVEKEADLYTDLCMRLIQNMPYGILKELSICSGSASIRKFENGFYNLQFVTGKGESLTEPFPENTEKPKADAGFQFWLDAVLSGRNDVSQMLHRFSGDIGNDSNKFLATLNLLKLLDDRINGIEGTALFEELVNHIVNGFAGKESGALIKRSFLSEQVCQYFCDERTFILSLSTIKQCNALDYKTFGFRERVLSFKHTRGIKEYISLLAELCRADFLNEEGRNLLSNALENMTNEEVIILINRDWPLFMTIVTLNNQVLAGEFWLELQPPQFISLFAIFQKNIPKGFCAWRKLYEKLLTIDIFVADNILSEFVKNVEEYIEVALDKWSYPKHMPINQVLLNHCMKQRSRVINWMSKQNEMNDELRTAVKRNICPSDTVVVSMGSSAWRAFVDGELKSQRDANGLVYIYVLAFNWHDNYALGYIKQVLPYIYEALSVESLSYSSWKEIEKFTGVVPFWRSWDNCRKVLLGVKEYCKTMQLSTKDIENFTTNQKLNGELMDLWRK